MYLLPKIHKRLRNVPGRQVVSNCGMGTENISAFVEYHISNIIPGISRILKDTTDFLKKLEDVNIPDNAIMVSFDVVGLYPHIPHEDGIEAMKRYLDLREEHAISTESLCDLTNIVLENNYFEFDDKVFHQKCGTAIGTKLAPYMPIFLWPIWRKEY